jgi:hypothetical protein
MKKMISTTKSVLPASAPAGASAIEDVSATFKVKVLPRASSNSIGVLENGEWKVKLTAPPIEGAANTALIQFLAEVLDVPRRNVTIIGGQNARNKLVRIDGLTAAQVQKKLKAEN